MSRQTAGSRASFLAVVGPRPHFVFLSRRCLALRRKGLRDRLLARIPRGALSRRAGAARGARERRRRHAEGARAPDPRAARAARRRGFRGDCAALSREARKRLRKSRAHHLLRAGCALPLENAAGILFRSRRLYRLRQVRQLPASRGVRAGCAHEMAAGGEGRRPAQRRAGGSAAIRQGYRRSGDRGTRGGELPERRNERIPARLCGARRTGTALARSLHCSSRRRACASITSIAFPPARWAAS